MDCHFFSDTLGMQTDMTVLLPQATTDAQIGVDTVQSDRVLHPCLWLLHGLSDDHTSWLRNTAVEQYVAPLGIAVVMPNVHRSFYTDMVYGGAYQTFLQEELPRIARSFFPLSSHREDNAIAGLSMGGYGTFKWALSCPDFAMAAASLSGVLDMSRRVGEARSMEEPALRRETLAQAFGDRDISGTPDDLFELARQRVADGRAPELLQICGTEDFLYPDHLSFRDHCADCGLHLDVREGPGDHTWSYWDQEIRTVLDWLTSLGFGSP